MTRSSLRRTLRRSYWVLALVLGISLVTRLAEHIPGIAGSPLEPIARSIYEYLKDMALVFVTVVAAYLASVFQKRHSFIEALREEWRDIIRAKSALFAFTQLERPTQQDYVTAFCAVSETIDNMRSVYRNVGETTRLVGLYPYEPLHDMRRALQTLEPRKNPDAGEEERRLVRNAVLRGWYALRERFLEELDLESPDNPLLLPGALRTKSTGTARLARAALEVQRKQQTGFAEREPEISRFLAELCEKEREQSQPPSAVQAQPKSAVPLPEGRVP